jgi:hypothetical protein
MKKYINVQGTNEVRPSDEQTVVPHPSFKETEVPVEVLEMCVNRRHTTNSSDRKTFLLSVNFVIFGKVKIFSFIVSPCIFHLQSVNISN